MEGEAVPAVLSRDRWSVPGALAAGTRGPRAPLGVVLGAGARVHPTLLVHHPLGWCPGPVVGGFAPGTQPVSRAGEYSGCVVLCCVVLCCVVLRCVVLCCVVLCCVVPKALLPKGKGRDVYPRVQVNGLGCVCCVRAVCKCVVA